MAVRLATEKLNASFSTTNEELQGLKGESRWLKKYLIFFLDQVQVLDYDSACTLAAKGKRLRSTNMN